jgi:hypothetical protein
MRRGRSVPPAGGNAEIRVDFPDDREHLDQQLRQSHRRIILGRAISARPIASIG